MASSSLALSPESLWKAEDAEKADVKSFGLTSVERYLKARRASENKACTGRMCESSFPQQFTAPRGQAWSLLLQWQGCSQHSGRHSQRLCPWVPACHSPDLMCCRSSRRRRSGLHCTQEMAGKS